MDKKIEKKLAKFSEDWIWLTRNLNSLKQQYPYEFVAIVQKEVYDHDKELENLMKRLEKKFKQDAKLIPVEYLTPDKPEMIL